MFFLVVSCVFFGVQWQLVVESLLPLQRLSNKNSTYVGFSIKDSVQIFLSELTPTYVGFPYLKKTASSRLFLGSNLINSLTAVVSYLRPHFFDFVKM
jgi:hypothetical protein